MSRDITANPEFNPESTVEDFIDGMVNGFFENLDELVFLSIKEKADVEMVIRHHIVNALLRRLKREDVE